MSTLEFEIQLIAVVVAVACALPGVFLVLRRMALMSDAISHTVLLGIVLAFFVTHDLNSPLLILGAAATGVLTVLLVETLLRTRLVKEDAAIGLVFPALFSVAVILIARHAGDVHLDTDAVLLGELAFAPFRRFAPGGTDLGPRALWVMGAILLVNATTLLLFYKELKLATFDAGLAAALGFSPVLVHYGFMTLVSVTVVGAFDAVGSILVVALMIAPPAAAYLLTDRLPLLILLSAVIAAVSAIGGYWAAHWLDASIAGSMATATGVCFLTAWFGSPARGLIAQARRRRRQRLDFSLLMLVIHLRNHEAGEDAAEESRVAHLHAHFRWSEAFAARVVGAARARGYVAGQNGVLRLTDAGRSAAQAALVV
jgi:manganese/zinc/iron transport system permease protein